MSAVLSLETPSLAEQVRDLVGSGKVAMPPLPELANRIIDMLRQVDEVDLSRVGSLMGKDPALVAAVLRMGNSAVFGGLRAVSTLEEAIARLGLRQVAQVVLTVSHRQHHVHNDPERLRLQHDLWDHAVATAFVGRRLAAGGGGDPAGTFLAGLLHDSGKLLVLRAVDELERRPELPRVTQQVLEELMDLLHTDLGHEVLKAWRIPDEVCAVALRHHDPKPSPDDVLLLRIQVANAMARKSGYHMRPDPELRLMELPAVDRLRLNDLELAELMVDLEDDINEVRRLL